MIDELERVRRKQEESDSFSILKIKESMFSDHVTVSLSRRVKVLLPLDNESFQVPAFTVFLQRG